MNPTTTVLDPTARPLPDDLQELALTYIAARRRSGESLLDAADALSQARALASHGEWGTWLETTATTADTAERLLNIHRLAVEDQAFRAAVASNFLGQTTAALIAAPGTPETVRATVLAQPKPPSTRQVQAAIAEVKPPISRSAAGNDPPPPIHPSRPEGASGFPPAGWDEARRLAREAGGKLWFNTAGNEFVLDAGLNGAGRQRYALGAWETVRRLVDPDAVPAAPTDPLAALCGELHALEARQAAALYDDDDRAALRALEERLEGLAADLDDGEYEGLAQQIGRLRAWKPAQPARADGAPMSRAEEARARAIAATPPLPDGWEDARTRAAAQGLRLWADHATGEYVLQHADGVGEAGRTRYPTWTAALAALLPPPDVAGALAAARAGMAQAAAQQEATALPPTGADGELYQRAERGPLAEILRLSPPALRLLSLTHFGGDRRDDDESTREWIWESLTSDTQALDEGALAWALGEAPAERKAAA